MDPDVHPDPIIYAAPDYHAPGTAYADKPTITSTKLSFPFFSDKHLNVKECVWLPFSYFSDLLYLNLLYYAENNFKSLWSYFPERSRDILSKRVSKFPIMKLGFDTEVEVILWGEDEINIFFVSS